jgi:formylglycine-generating enzyme required for sulfatase activity
MRKSLGIALVVLVATSWSSAAAADTVATQPAKELTLDLGNGASMKLVLIPAGKFLMGSPVTEIGRNTDETQHEVTITKPFYMGVTHVTVDQFAAFVADSGYKTDAEKHGVSPGFVIRNGAPSFKDIKGCSWRKPSFPQAGDHPVIQVSWEDANAFCAWLSKRSGNKVVLPTEAQWEYACRAGSRAKYFFGSKDSELDDYAWYRKNSHTSSHPVGEKKPNAWGLYDMYGNVWEWCADRYSDEYYAHSPTDDPTGPAKGTGRVVRGGSWDAPALRCRSARRAPFDPLRADYLLGLRIAFVPAAN